MGRMLHKKKSTMFNTKDFNSQIIPIILRVGPQKKFEL